MKIFQALPGEDHLGGGVLSDVSVEGAAPRTLTLSFFRATREGDLTRIEWSTATEVGNQDFFHERDLHGETDLVDTRANLPSIR